MRTSRTWNKCQGFHDSPWNGQSASHGPSRCTGTSTEIRPINVDFFSLLDMFLCTKISPKTEAFKEWYIYLLIQNMRVWKNLLSSQCLNLCGDNLNEILEIHQICKGGGQPLNFSNDWLTYIGEFFVTLQGLNDASMIIPKTELFNPVELWIIWIWTQFKMLQQLEKVRISIFVEV